MRPVHPLCLALCVAPPPCLQAFLLRFRPVNALLNNTAGTMSPSGTNSPRGVSENIDAILEMLQKNRYELESLFRHFGQ
jgi:hypothetical protein